MSPMPPFVNHKWATFPVPPFGEGNYREKVIDEIDFVQQLGAKLHPKKEESKPAEPSPTEKRLVEYIGKLGEEVGKLGSMMRQEERDDELARAKAMGFKEGEEKARQAMGAGIAVGGWRNPLNGHPDAISGLNILPGHMMPVQISAPLVPQSQYVNRRRSSTSELAAEIMQRLVRREERMDYKLKHLERRTSWIEQETHGALGRVRSMERRADAWDGGLNRIQMVERRASDLDGDLWDRRSRIVIYR